MKSHTFFLLATVNVSPPPTADNKKDWGGVGGWKQLEAKSNLPWLAHVYQARVIV